MYKNTRPHVWETNSSSIHTLVIGDSVPETETIPKNVVINTGEWEREEDTVWGFQERLDYLFTYLLSADTEENFDRYVDRLVNFLKAHGAETVALPDTHPDLWYAGYHGYDGHVGNDVGSLRSDILWWYDDDDKLLRYLLGPESHVTIEDEDYS